MTPEIKAHILAAFAKYFAPNGITDKYTVVENYVYRRMPDVDLNELRYWIDECAGEAGVVRTSGRPEFKNSFYARFN